MRVLASGLAISSMRVEDGSLSGDKCRC